MNKPAIGLLGLLWGSLLYLFLFWYLDVHVAFGADGNELEQPQVGELFLPPKLPAKAIANTAKPEVKGNNAGSEGNGSLPDSAEIAAFNAEEEGDSLNKSNVPKQAGLQFPANLNNRKIDSSAQKILLIGDSMAECIFFSFSKYAKYSGHKLKGVFWYGSTTLKWAKSDTVRRLIAKHKPSLIIISLGANELFIKNINSREKALQKILAQMDSVPYLYVSPPNWKPDYGLTEMLERNIPPDQFFLSRDLVLERRKDGAHPTMKASLVWGDTIANWIVQRSKYPFLIVKNKIKKNDTSALAKKINEAKMEALLKENRELAVIKKKLETTEKDLAWLRKQLQAERHKTDSLQQLAERKGKTSGNSGSKNAKPEKNKPNR